MGSIKFYRVWLKASCKQHYILQRFEDYKPLLLNDARKYAAELADKEFPQGWHWQDNLIFKLDAGPGSPMADIVVMWTEESR